MFGKPAFGSPAPSTSFGSTGLFGQPAPTGGGLFNSTSTFGQQNKPTGFGFGTPQQNNTFLGAQQPQASSIFNPSGSTGLFGGSTAFGSQQTGTVIKFNPVTGTDTMMKNGTAQSISTKHHSITCMKEYENKSFEELRFEDYQANRKGPQQTTAGFGAPAFGASTTTPSLFGQADANKQSAFGQTSVFGQATTFGQNTAGQQGTTGFGAPVFGAVTSSTPSLFGQADANKSAFGQAGAFGQTSTFGQNTTGGFGLGAQQNTTGSPFGKPTAFGAPTSSTGFGFGTNTAQNANPFGAATANKPFGTATAAQPLGFGTNTSQPNTGFGTGLFSNTQNTGTGLFNKPAQATGGFGTAGQTPGFSFNTPASTQSSLFTNTSKSLFGGNTTSTAPAFGTTNNTFGATNTGFGSTFGKPNTTPFGQTSAIGSFSSGFGSTGFGSGNTSFGSTFGKPTAPVFGQSQAPGLGTFNSGGLGTTTSTGLFGNQNQAKPGGLFGNSNSLFNNNSSMNFQQNSFGVGPLNQQQMSLLAQPEQNANNLALLTTDPFGDAPHLAGLEPKLRSNNDAVSATDPKELKSLLDASKKVDMTHNSKLKVTPLQNARDSLFDSLPKPTDNIKSPLANYQKTSVRRLVLKQRPSGENTPGLNSTNILDVLTSEDKENRNLDSGGGGGNKVNPLKLTFDVSANNDTFTSNNSVETQTFNIVNSTSKDQLPDHSLRESPPPPSDDDDQGDNKGAGGDTIKRHPANIVCTRPEYYTLPSLDDLVPDENGACFVKGFTVGRKGYGNVYFPDEMDVAGLNLDELVHFRYREINVYPDDAKKPPVGQGLNRKAQVTLDNVYPRRTGSNALIKDVGELIQMNFAEKLRKVTEKKNARFVDYRPETGSWVFKVDHFSKYGFNDSDEENDQNGAADAAKKAAKQEELQKTTKPLETLTKESLEDKAKDQEIISRETSEGSSQEPSSGAFRLDKDILIDDDDEHEENDLLHHSMMVDEGSEEDFRHHLHADMPMMMDYGSYTRSQRAKNIQLMKTTLFADDDRLSEDARSHISIMKQYLDLPEMDEISRLPTVPEEQVPARRRAVLRPKVWKSYVSANAAPVLPSRCCVDMGMFKGKSFRVGWTKGFNFYTLNSGVATELVLKSIDASPNFDPLKDVLSDSLKIVLEESTHHLDASKIPTFKVLKSDAYLKKQSAVFEKLASQYNSSQANYLYGIWTLCNALWGPGDNTIANRRYLLTEWLKSTCNNDELTLKSGPFKSVGDASESVFSHLSVFKVFDAASIAMETRLPHLSLLVAQLSMSNAAKSFVQEQIDIWYRSLASNHISRELKRLYLLLAGIPTKDDVNIFDNVDWKRAFGMHLWYICPNGAPIETAIELYKKAFEEYSYAARPSPPYVKSYCDEDGPFDIMYHILLLYKSGIHRLSSVLNPATHTDDPLDYRLSWLLLQLFLSLDVGLIESSEINKLCTSFSTQLEHLGHWEWAIFVLLHMEDNSIKTNIIMGILDRNLNADFDETAQEIVDLLVNEMKIPPEWIHSVKGNKSLITEKYFEAFNHFALAEDYVKANTIFVDNLLPTLFINEQFDVIRSLTEKLRPACKDILHWQNEAGLVLDYLDLLEQSITADNVVKLQMKLCSLSDRIVNFPTITDSQRLCVAELSKRCASLYKDLCYKSHSNLLESAYIQFVETLIMPPDFKKNEGLYLIHDFYNFRINNRV